LFCKDEAFSEPELMKWLVAVSAVGFVNSSQGVIGTVWQTSGHA